MNIKPLIPGINNYVNIVNNKKNIDSKFHNSQSFLSMPNDSFTLSKSDMSFTGKSLFITDKSVFRDYAKHGHVGCIWCNNRMFTQEEIDSIKALSPRITKNGGLFSRVMLHFKDYFSKDKIILLKQIGKLSSIYPDKDLKFVISKMRPKAEKNLINKQFSIFDDLKSAAEQLPKKQRKEIDQLLEHSKCRILEIPYVSEYSGKEFVYQLCRITKNMQNSDGKYIRESANLLRHPYFKDEGSISSKKMLANVYKHLKINPHSKGNYISPKDSHVKLKIQTLILDNIRNRAIQTKQNDVVDLCDLTMGKLYNEKVVLKFSNKAFKYKLHEILESFGDKEYVAYLERIAEDLPTSENNRNAFVVKYCETSNQNILSHLLDSSRVTIEHLTPILRHTSAKDLNLINSKLPKSDRIYKGDNTIENWALACNYCNGVHGSDDIKGENFPFSIEAGKKYFETIINDANKGFFTRESVINMVQNYTKQTGLTIDTSKLKLTPDDIY